MGVDHLSLRFTIHELLKGYTFGVTHDLSAHSSLQGDVIWMEHANGFVHSSRVWGVSPLSERAITRLLVDEGVVAKEKGADFAFLPDTWNEARFRVGFLRDLIRRSIGKGKRINASHIIRIDDTLIGANYLNVMLRNYTKKDDMLTIKTITEGEHVNRYPVRFASPCGDWEMIIAPRVVGDDESIDDVETVARLTTTNNEATKEDQE